MTILNVNKLGKNKKKVLFEISKYKELLDKYVDFEKNIKHKKLPDNIILDHLSSLSFKHIYPVTTHGFQIYNVNDNQLSTELYNILSDLIDVEMNDQYDKNILLQNPNDFWGYDEEALQEYFGTSMKFSNQKNKPQDKVLKNNHHTKLFILEKEDDIDTQQSRYYGVKNNKLTYVPQYQTTLDMNSSIYYDGYMFPKRKKSSHAIGYDGQTSLLSKSLQKQKCFL